MTNSTTNAASNEQLEREFDHFSIVPFKAVCGADVLNQSTTQDPRRAKCAVCWQYWKEWESSYYFEGRSRVSDGGVVATDLISRSEAIQAVEKHNAKFHDLYPHCLTDCIPKVLRELPAAPATTPSPDEALTVEKFDTPEQFIDAYNAASLGRCTKEAAEEIVRFTISSYGQISADDIEQIIRKHCFPTSGESVSAERNPKDE
jgi:hypothetical protein